MDEPQLDLCGVCTPKMSNFNIWLVIPLGAVKFDVESIGDGFMSDGKTQMGSVHQKCQIFEYGL